LIAGWIHGIIVLRSNMNKTVLLVLWIILLVVGISGFYFIRVENQRITVELQHAVAAEKDASAEVDRLQRQVDALRKYGGKLPMAPLSIAWKKLPVGDRLAVILQNKANSAVDFRVTASAGASVVTSSYATLPPQSAKEIPTVQGHQLVKGDQVRVEVVGYEAVSSRSQ
jgi:cell division protein FtsL